MLETQPATSDPPVAVSFSATIFPLPAKDLLKENETLQKIFIKKSNYA